LAHSSRTTATPSYLELWFSKDFNPARLQDRGCRIPSGRAAVVVADRRRPIATTRPQQDGRSGKASLLVSMTRPRAGRPAQRGQAQGRGGRQINPSAGTLARPFVCHGANPSRKDAFFAGYRVRQVDHRGSQGARGRQGGGGWLDQPIHCWIFQRRVRIRRICAAECRQSYFDDPQKTFRYKPRWAISQEEDTKRPRSLSVFGQPETALANRGRNLADRRRLQAGAPAWASSLEGMRDPGTATAPLERSDPDGRKRQVACFVGCRIGPGF